MAKPTLLLKSDELQLLATIETDQSATVEITGLQISKSISISIPYLSIINFVNGITKSINRISGDVIEVNSTEQNTAVWKFWYDHVVIEFLDSDNNVEKTLTMKRGEILALAGFLYDYMKKEYHV